MEKGSLHLYLVAKTDILESEEITVAHDSKNPLPCPYEGCPHMKNKDSGARTGLAPSATPAPPPPPVLSPVETDRKRRRRRTNSMATNDASSNLNTTNSSASGPSESPATTPVTTSVQQAAQASVPSTPPLALPPTPVKRQSRTPSKVSAVVTEGEDSQDDSLLPDEGDGPGSLDNESSSNKKKLVNSTRTYELTFIDVFYYCYSLEKKGKWRQS